ncbi:MAG: O-sialoglycoprotein endopeptidase [Bacillota bacterium]|nr:O-sialoglycoprotein endopeptidase [Bacillota bacterium]
MKENINDRFYLGLDTSAYTTSLALVNGREELIADRRLPLRVKKGSIGLRQSEAVFAHLANLPLLWQKGEGPPSNGQLKAVAFSDRPRPEKNSYMPVFKVGEASALLIAQTTGLAAFRSTHQEGHIMAGLWSAGMAGGCYLVFHLSGGTTEILSVSEEKPGNLHLELIGGSADLQAGQFIDRMGRDFGFPFPAGLYLEKAACSGEENKIRLPVSVNGLSISFSGPASHARRLWEKGCRMEDLARAIEICIADSLAEAVQNVPGGAEAYSAALAVGGVTGNRFIKQRLQKKLPSWQIFFAPEYASDNAVGLAVQAARLDGYGKRFS